MPVCGRCGKNVKTLKERYRFEVDELDPEFEKLEQEYLALPVNERDVKFKERFGASTLNDVLFYAQLKNTTCRRLECHTCYNTPSLPR